MSYNKYKGKLLARVFKGASKDRKDSSKTELNRAADVAMISTYKRNKLEIASIVQYRKSMTKSNIDAGYKAPKWSWVESKRLQIRRSQIQSEKFQRSRKWHWNQPY